MEHVVRPETGTGLALAGANRARAPEFTIPPCPIAVGRYLSGAVKCVVPGPASGRGGAVRTHSCVRTT